MQSIALEASSMTVIAEPPSSNNQAVPSLEKPASIAPSALIQSLTLEHGLYVLIFGLSIMLHLWGLGDRAMHHDETLHARISYSVFQGTGFVHDPLLHGPFLYFWTAFIYFLFGDSDGTARLAAAIFGSVLTVLPFLMRREMGRAAALAASALMLISPAILYVGRFIRHDIFAVTFEVLSFIAVVRYLSSRQVRWLYIGAASLALMFTTMETFFLYLVIFVPLLIALALWRVWRPGIAVLAGLALFVALVMFVFPGTPERPSSLSDTVNRVNGNFVCPQVGSILTDNPMLIEKAGFLGIPPLPTADNQYALCVRHQPDNNLGVYLVKLWPFFSHPAVVLSMLAVLITLGLLYYMLWRKPGPAGQTRWQHARHQGDSLIEGLASLGQNRHWLAALGLGSGLYALFFSSFFTNPLGVITGTTGSLLYWLAQHEVQRGSQPRHFYLVILNIYEPLLLLWGSVGLVLTLRLLLRHWREPPGAGQHGRPADTRQQTPETRHETADQDTGTPGATQYLASGARQVAHTLPIDWSLVMPLMLSWWSLAALFLYSWAGEKMPWLTIHMAVPLALLAGWALAQVLGWWQRSWTETQSRYDSSAVWPLALYLGIFASVVMMCFLLIVVALNAPENGGFLPWVTLIGLALIALLTIGAAMLISSRWALGALAIGLTLTGAMYELRSAYMLNYLWGDVPREMMIYTQTSPDVKRVVERLESAMVRRGGSAGLPVWYDNETVWDWYMRHFTKAQERAASDIPPAPADLTAMLLLEENLNDQNRQNLTGFRVQRYPLRWWFPEDATYRLPEDWLSRPVDENSPLLMRILRAPFEMQTARQYWNYMLFRIPPAGLGSSDFVLVIRPEMANEIGWGTGELK